MMNVYCVAFGVFDVLHNFLFQDWTGQKTVRMMSMMKMKMRQGHSFLSRALGDHEMGQYHNMHPHIISLPKSSYCDFCGPLFEQFGR